MHVTIETAQLVGHEVPISMDAAELVRLGFNPSGSDAVAELKALAAAFLSALERLPAAEPGTARELAIARTEMQTAAMFAVAAATR